MFDQYQRIGYNRNLEVIIFDGGVSAIATAAIAVIVAIAEE